MKRTVIFVSGASAGIGEATARRLARAGYTVYGGARRMDRLKTLEADGVRPVLLDIPMMLRCGLSSIRFSGKPAASTCW